MDDEVDNIENSTGKMGLLFFPFPIKFSFFRIDIGFSIGIVDDGCVQLFF
jgi:hypothetical protein